MLFHAVVVFGPFSLVILSRSVSLIIKFRYSGKATKVWPSSTYNLTILRNVKKKEWKMDHFLWLSRNIWTLLCLKFFWSHTLIILISRMQEISLNFYSFSAPLLYVENQMKDLGPERSKECGWRWRMFRRPFYAAQNY